MNNPEKIANVCNAGCAKRYNSMMFNRGRVVEDLQDNGYTVVEKGCTGVCGFVVEVPDTAVVNLEISSAPSREISRKVAVLTGEFEIEYVDPTIIPDDQAV